ncbi:MAG: hypothetical protein FWF84_02505, partial [Kiritimatiellaeota bacterium]|nr:hypothetical protein [Kiritimatiellota bacterium]
ADKSQMDADSFFHFSLLAICVHPFNLRHLRSHDMTSAKRSKCFCPDEDGFALDFFGAGVYSRGLIL